MSSPEHRVTIERKTVKAYAPGGVELIEQVVNKGRLPKSKRTLTNHERKRMKDEASGRADALNSGVREVNRIHPEGILFTFNPRG